MSTAPTTLTVTHVWVNGMLLHVVGTKKEINMILSTASATGSLFAEFATVNQSMTDTVPITVNRRSIDLIEREHPMVLGGAKPQPFSQEDADADTVVLGG